MNTLKGLYTVNCRLGRLHCYVGKQLIDKEWYNHVNSKSFKLYRYADVIKFIENSEFIFCKDEDDIGGFLE